MPRLTISTRPTHFEYLPFVACMSASQPRETIDESRSHLDPFPANIFHSTHFTIKMADLNFEEFNTKLNVPAPSADEGPPLEGGVPNHQLVDEYFAMPPETEYSSDSDESTTAAEPHQLTSSMHSDPDINKKLAQATARAQELQEQLSASHESNFCLSMIKSSNDDSVSRLLAFSVQRSLGNVDMMQKFERVLHLEIDTDNIDAFATRFGIQFPAKKVSVVDTADLILKIWHSLNQDLRDFPVQHIIDISIAQLNPTEFRFFVPIIFQGLREHNTFESRSWNDDAALAWIFFAFFISCVGFMNTEAWDLALNYLRGQTDMLGQEYEVAPGKSEARSRLIRMLREATVKNLRSEKVLCAEEVIFRDYLDEKERQYVVDGEYVVQDGTSIMLVKASGPGLRIFTLNEFVLRKGADSVELVLNCMEGEEVKAVSDDFAAVFKPTLF